ncbi:MAG: hypothetical protein IPH31_14050 [Lewinellaceae bacterium]|nr:hypothetical protein [Lewinellaceae bacterium]
MDGIVLVRNITRSDIKVSQNAVSYLSTKGVDSLARRDSLEIDLIETIQQLETDITNKKGLIEKS